MKQLRVAVLIIFATAVSSCSQNPTRVIKVLNRVQCHEDHKYCSQDTIDKIWNICLRNNYQTIAPESNVISARELRELVSETVLITTPTTTYKDVVGELGIVTKIPVKTQSRSNQTTRGYCLGSEYIK